MIRVDDCDMSWREGMTIADLLKELPDTGQCVVVRLNDKFVSSPDFEKTLIPDQAQMFLIPMIAGG